MTEDEKLLEQQFEDLVEMFNGPGWKFFIEETIRPNLDQIRSAMITEDDDKQLLRYQGGARILVTLLGFEVSQRQAFEDFHQFVNNPEEEKPARSIFLNEDDEDA